MKKGVFMENKIRVLIAEDLEPIRKKYVYYLSQCADIELVGSVESGKEAVETALSAVPDVILMDIEMETKDAGIRASREILAHYPDIKIIILTVYEDDELIFSAFQLGVCDYMLKNSTNEEIISGIKAAHEGRSPIRPEIAGKIRSEFKRVKTYETSFLYMLNLLSSLTVTELDTLYLLSSGHTRADICAIRHVEMSTVKSQIHSILHKFKKKSIVEIITSTEDLHLLELVIKNRPD